MTNGELIEAIRKATSGTFIGEYYSSTCMGWIRKYDEQGRQVTTDPNWIESTINVDNKEYKIIKRGWKVWILKDTVSRKMNYCSVMCSKNIHEKYPDDIIFIDETPNYVKEYYNNKERCSSKEYITNKPDNDCSYIYAPYIPAETIETLYINHE